MYKNYVQIYSVASIIMIRQSFNTRPWRHRVLHASFYFRKSDCLSLDINGSLKDSISPWPSGWMIYWYNTYCVTVLWMSLTWLHSTFSMGRVKIQVRAGMKSRLQQQSLKMVLYFGLFDRAKMLFVFNWQLKTRGLCIWAGQVFLSSNAFFLSRAFLPRLAPFCRNSRLFVATRAFL